MNDPQGGFSMLFWIFTTLLAFFVKGICGFANTLVFAALLSFTSDHSAISPVSLIVGLPSNLIMALRDRKAISWRICAPLCAFVLAGMVPGVLFLKNADARLVKLLFGFVIILLGAENLLRERRPRTGKSSQAALAVIGVLSGVLCGLYGVGALMSAYLSRVTDDSRTFKANLCVVFFVENAVRAMLYALWGLLTPAILLRGVALIPFMLLGLYAGLLCSKRLDERAARQAVIWALIVSGAAMIVSNL